MTKAGEWIQNLSRRPSDLDFLSMNEKFAKLETEKVRVSALSHALKAENVTRLNLARIGSSNSLGKDNLSRSWWDESNQLVHKWILEDRPLDWESLQILNSMLTSGKHNISEPREHAVYTGGNSHLSVDELDEILEWLKQALATEAEFHPIHFAALVRYWLVSIHPFSDGNGRTSTLAADWILLKNGYPPFCFARVVEGTVAFGEDKDWATPERAIAKSCEALAQSFLFLR